jgi:hypothetical protein
MNKAKLVVLVILVSVVVAITTTLAQHWLSGKVWPGTGGVVAGITGGLVAALYVHSQKRKRPDV